MFKYLIVTFFLLTVQVSFAENCLQTESRLRDGDLVFFGLSNVVFRQLAAATNSWTSHLGIVFKSENGKWMVAESLIPFSRKTEFCHFIQRGYKKYFEIHRLKSSFPENKKSELISEIDQRMGKPYDLGFNYNTSKMFCSKFVYDIFYKILGVQVGHLQTFRDLQNQNPTYDFSFWKYWFGGRIPWERQTVTPASQVEDEDLVEIYRSHQQRPF